MIFNSLESFSYELVLDFPASTSMHIIYHDHAVNKFTKLVTLDLLATNVLSGAKVQLIKISAILKNLDFWSNFVIELHQALHLHKWVKISYHKQPEVTNPSLE